jgi:pimeloyl-ACP methyl ester carboxylesterase
MPFASLHGQKIHYEDTGGPGRPLILGHDFPLDSRMFDPQALELAPEFRIIRWDARALGRTHWDGKPFSLWDSADDCMALLDYLGIEQAVVGGVSLGGQCALRAALRYPQRVKALVLLGTRATREDPQLREIYLDMARIWSAEGPIDPLLHILASEIFGEPFRFRHWYSRWRVLSAAHILASTMCLMDRDDIYKQIKDIRCPSIILHGSEDLSVPPAQGELLHLMMSGQSSFVPISGAAHAANLTHPHAVNPPLLEFLRAHA